MTAMGESSRRNLPDNVDELAQEIRVRLAAEDPIEQAAKEAADSAVNAYNAATREAEAEYRAARDKFSAIQTPVAQSRDAALAKARKTKTWHYATFELRPGIC